MRKKQVFLVIIAIMLILPSFLVNAAQNKTSQKSDETEQVTGEVAAKDEVVYATLSATGTQKEIYVVNILDVLKAGTVTDYGAYSSVKNLTDVSAIEQDGNTVLMNASKGKFYYQGNMEDKQLPWDVAVSYSLDGQEFPPEELAGKSGHLELNIVTSANKDVDPLFYENYLLQISLVLDSEIYSNIQAPEASIANAGKNKQITFTVMPEKDGEFSLEADVTDFEMEGIEIAAVPSSMSIELPDTNEMTNDLKSLSDAMEQVNSGVYDLKIGVSELNDGVASLRDGSESYQDGMEEIDTASAGIIEGSGMINDTLSMMSQSLKKESEEMDMSELMALPEGLSQLSEGLIETADLLTTVQEGYSQAYAALDGAMAEIPVDLESELQELYMSNLNSETIEKLVATYEAALTAKATYESEPLQGAFAGVEATLSGVSDSLRETGNKLAADSSELATSLENMDITESFTQLQEGLAELSDNYGEFHLGLVGYTDGVTELADSYGELHSGIVGLSEGTNELESGVNELHDGTSELAESTGDIPDQMQQEIDNMMDDYDKSDFKSVSYVSVKNSNINSVQFVIKTESIKIEEEESISEDEEEEETGFWSRLKDLFI